MVLYLALMSIHLPLHTLTAVITAFLVIGVTQPVFAAPLSISPVVVRFTESSIPVGYTLKTEGDECYIGVPPDAFVDVSDATIRLRHIPKKRIKSRLKEETSLSPVFGYVVQNDVQIQKPLWVSIAWKKETDQTYVIKQWNEETSVWDTLESTIDEATSRVKAQVTSPKGIIGVFEAPNETELRGIASWYHWHGAAMNDFPYGTKVLVINAETGEQAETVVVSTGPFVEGRIIDLPYDIFNKISDTSKGVVEVIVREVKE